MAVQQKKRLAVVSQVLLPLVIVTILAIALCMQDFHSCLVGIPGGICSVLPPAGTVRAWCKAAHATKLVGEG